MVVPSQRARAWCVVTAVVVVVAEVVALNGPNVCMVQQKYNVTKRVKYRAPMSVRTYEWCFSIPPRCSKWNTEMRDLTRLETEERTAEVAVCCPGYKMRDVSCVPICPNGKTGAGCSQDCPPNKWGPNCVNECSNCTEHGSCSGVTGECGCQEGWQGERCDIRITTTQAPTTLKEEILTTAKFTTITLPSTTKQTEPSTSASTTKTTITTPMATTSATEASSTAKITTSTPTTLSTITYIKSTSTNNWAVQIKNIATESMVPKYTITDIVYNRTETPSDVMDIDSTLKSPTTTTIHTSSPSTIKNKVPKLVDSTTKATSLPRTIATTLAAIVATPTMITSPTTALTTTEIIPKTDTTNKTETTVKAHPTSVKFKPKEIWIRPTQKGESIVDIKIKSNNEMPHPKHRSTKKEINENTTPRTIIVSIIPTSVSYATFKKIALTTASYMSQKSNASLKYNKTEQSTTKSMLTSTLTPHTIKALSTSNNKTVVIPITDVTKSTFLTSTRTSLTNKSTNSMVSTLIYNKSTKSSKLTTPISTNSYKSNDHLKSTTRMILIDTNSTQRPIIKYLLPKTLSNMTEAEKSKTIQVSHTKTEKGNENITNTPKLTTADDTVEDETFHILTEPEHITAVISDKERDRTSVDLISVISIAGGVMMAVIMVAVIIVMVERCKRHRYDDVRKINDIRMQVLIDNDVPPPYVRSIFHTPLPEPPSSEKCHYQPISTLDRNLKQFMRPVVVQAISPIMLENFRGILECHYDHLPRRNHDFSTLPTRCTAPSMSYHDELRSQRPLSVTDYTIESLKCEAKLDVIDNTTSEPLYAEIPCWRPPSEHAVEVINLNGEAVTEL